MGLNAHQIMLARGATLPPKTPCLAICADVDPQAKTGEFIFLGAPFGDFPPGIQSSLTLDDLPPSTITIGHLAMIAAVQLEGVPLNLATRCPDPRFLDSLPRWCRSG